MRRRDIPHPSRPALYPIELRTQCALLIVITLLLRFTMVIVIAAFLDWRCCCFLSSDCLICGVNIDVKAFGSQKHVN